MELFGTEITLRSEHCSLKEDQVKYNIDIPYLNLYVKLQNHCNANCKFCEFRGEKRIFNYNKFVTLLKKIREKIVINKLSFTGGEPTLDLDLLFKCVRYVKAVDKNIFTVVNTNGINLIQMDNLKADSIALSRHHYDDKINNEILGFKINSEIIKKFKNKNILHLSCNLIKNYIDSEQEVIKYLEKSSELGVYDVGFVSLMKVNDFCKNNHIDFIDFDFSNFKSIKQTKIWNHNNNCRCSNFLYISESDANIVKMYSRYYVNSNNCESTLVYDGENLRLGFNGKIII